MPSQHAIRRSRDRRTFDLASSSIEKERRWNKDPRGHLFDDDELYDADWETAEANSTTNGDEWRGD